MKLIDNICLVLGAFLFLVLFYWFYARYWFRRLSITKKRLIREVKRLYRSADKISARKGLRKLSRIKSLLEKIRLPALYVDNRAGADYDLCLNEKLFSKQWNDCFEYLKKVNPDPHKHADFYKYQIRDMIDCVYKLLLEEDV